MVQRAEGGSKECILEYVNCRVLVFFQATCQVGRWTYKSRVRRKDVPEG
jgi:hypothetical protein